MTAKGYDVIERTYGASTSKGYYEVHRRMIVDHDSVDTMDQAFMTFPHTQHEVWGWEELAAMKSALDKFFAGEKAPGDGRPSETEG